MGRNHGGAGGRQQVHLQPVHRFTFAQYLMKRGVVSERDAFTAFQQMTGSGEDALMDDLIAEVNDSMDGLHLRIRKIKHPLDDEVYVGLVNTHDDAPAKLATRYTHQQLEYFKAVLEHIACEDRGAPRGMTAVSDIYLLNLQASAAAATQAASPAQGTQAAHAAPPKLSKTEKAETLQRLAEEGWLAASPVLAGHFCVGVRTFLELPDLLKQMDLPEDTRAAWADVL